MMIVRCLECQVKIKSREKRVMLIFAHDGTSQDGKRLGSFHPECFKGSKQVPASVLPLTG